MPCAVACLDSGGCGQNAVAAGDCAGALLFSVDESVVVSLMRSSTAAAINRCAAGE